MAPHPQAICLNATARYALAFALLLCYAFPALAQRADTARAGMPQVSAEQARRDSLSRPPISPRRAFLYSLVAPGYGQIVLQRPNASVLFAVAEIGALGMMGKSAQDLREARRAPKDSVVGTYQIDPVTGFAVIDPATGLPKPATFIASRFNADRVRARRTHYEDWLAILIFNHLIAGADAYVAAHLWDLPANIVVRPGRDGTTIAARIAF